jgi:phage FluMu gp28-like protein
VLIEQAMVADRSIRIYRYEAPEGFESWTPQMREAEVKAWCEENLLPELARLDANDRHTFGEDFARRGDLTIFCPLAIKPSLRKRVPFVVELRNLTYEAQRQIMIFICDRLPRRGGLAFDATGNGGYLAEQAALRYGIASVDQVSLNAGWYALWMPKMKGEFEACNLELPRHQNTLDDLLHIKVVAGIPLIDKGRDKDLESKDGKGRRHGDFAVALVMANRATWMTGGALDFTEVPRTPRGMDSITAGDDDLDDLIMEQQAW